MMRLNGVQPHSRPIWLSRDSENSCSTRQEALPPTGQNNRKKRRSKCFCCEPNKWERWVAKAIWWLGTHLSLPGVAIGPCPILVQPVLLPLLADGRFNQGLTKRPPPQGVCPLVYEVSRGFPNVFAPRDRGGRNIARRGGVFRFPPSGSAYVGRGFDRATKDQRFCRIDYPHRRARHSLCSRRRST